MKHWRYDTAADLNQSILERLKNFPREPDILIYLLRSISAFTVRAWLKIYHRLEIHGRENLPATGSFVMVCNHSSHLDAPCLTAALPMRKLHRAFPAAAEDYFFKSIPRIWISAIVINALPFSRQIHIRESLALCAKLLETPGNILIVFPEGTRSSSGELAAFKPGIGSLLAGRGIPVIPCHLEGAHAAWNRYHMVPRPRKLSLVIGAPRCYEQLEPGRESGHAIAVDLQQAVLDLSTHHERH